MQGRFSNAMGMVAAVVTMLFAGCVSNQPGSSSTACVVINGSSLDAIHKETLRVFGDEQYTAQRQTSVAIVFARNATQRDKVLFGSFAGGDFQMEVDVVFEVYQKGGYLVRADAFVVQPPAGRQKIMSIASRPYQELLDRVRASLVTSSGNQE